MCLCEISSVLECLAKQWQKKKASSDVFHTPGFVRFKQSDGNFLKKHSVVASVILINCMHHFPNPIRSQSTSSSKQPMHFILFQRHTIRHEHQADSTLSPPLLEVKGEGGVCFRKFECHISIM